MIQSAIALATKRRYNLHLLQIYRTNCRGVSMSRPRAPPICVGTILGLPAHRKHIGATLKVARQRHPSRIAFRPNEFGIVQKMFEDPELPDFDSMSQEELIEWLEQLTKMQGASASENIDDPVDEQGRSEPVNPADETDENWTAWLDDMNAEPPAPAPIAEDEIPVGDSFEDADEETPVDLARYVDDKRGPLDAAAMAWLAEISAAETEEELPRNHRLSPAGTTPRKLRRIAR